MSWIRQLSQRLAEQVVEEKRNQVRLQMKHRYTIPGLDGTWKLMGLETADLAADGRATLHFIREAS